MGAPPLSGPLRRRLATILSEEAPGNGRLLTRLRELGRNEETPVFSAALHLLAHLSLPDAQAERVLQDLLRHRGQLARDLGRDPGLHVAAIDYLSNVKKLLVNPAIVERSHLEQTERSAITDVLTGLFNKRYFTSSLRLEVQRSRRYSLRLSLLMLDLDGFKRLNDEHGHVFGDLVLRRVGSVLRRAVRDADLACRFGGEEFAVILPETDRLGGYAVAQRIRDRVDRGFRERPIAGKAVRIGLSGGIATYPDDATDAEGLVARADQALYLSKRAGKDRISLYHSERRREVRYPGRAAARGRVVFAAGEQEYDARTLNLSRHGALLELERECPSSGRVELVFSGRVGERRCDWSRAGSVVRVERGFDDARRRRVAVALDEALPEDCLMQQVLRSDLLRRAGGAQA